MAKAFRDLCNKDPRKWTLVHDEGCFWGVLTTNDSKCYNNTLRGARDLPITTCVRVTFYHLVVTFTKKQLQIGRAVHNGLRYISKVQKKIESYQARSAIHRVNVFNW